LFRHASELSAIPDLKTFFEQWVYCDGYPLLTCKFVFNRKKHATELVVKQTQHTRPGDLGLRFQGSVIIRIHESSRSADHVRRVDDEEQEFEFACSSRLRRNRKRKAVEEEKLGLEALLQRQNESPVLWIRIDPVHTWFRSVVIQQDEAMWVHQLHSDKDVVAQYEAIQGLKGWAGRGHHLLGPNALRDTLQDEKCFYHVRMNAAMALAQTARERTGDRNTDVLLDTFKTQYYEDGLELLRPNDFSDFADYFVKRSIPQALACVTDHTHCTPHFICQFILDLLKYNDNSKNKYSDSYYLATLIRSLGSLKLARNTDLEPYWEELQRYLAYDALIPSYHHVITQAVLETVVCFEQQRKLEGRVKYVDYTSARFGGEVRVTSVKCMATLAPARPQEFVPSILTTLENEAVPGVKLSMIQAVFKAFVTSGSDALDVFRTLDQANFVFMNRLWTLLCTSDDPRLCHALHAVYGLLWGKNAPIIATHLQREEGREFIRRQENRDAKGKKKEFSKNLKRRFKAVASQQERRAARKMKGGGVPTGKLVFKLKAGSVQKVQKGDLSIDDDDDFL